MHRAAAWLAFLVLIAVWNLPAYGQGGQKQGEKKEQPKAKRGTAALTGCVDEQEGQYILIDDRTRTPIANLEAEGFPIEGLAKHLGHKVTVRGTSSPGTDRPLFKVRSIATINETCEPPAL